MHPSKFAFRKQGGISLVVQVARWALFAVWAVLASEAAVGADTKGPVANPAFIREPFDPAATKLPAGFRGHSAADIFRAISPVPQKGEYEKTVDFEARLAAWKSRRYFGSLTLESTLVFEVKDETAVTMNYRADDEVLVVTLRPDDLILVGPWAAVSTSEKALGTVPVRTRAGIRMVRAFEVTRFGLFLSKSVMAPRELDTNVSPASARALKKRLAVFIAGTLEEPYTSSQEGFEEWRDDGSITLRTHYRGLMLKPRAALLLDRGTGAVLDRIDW